MVVAYEERIVCNQCSTVLDLKEEVNIDPICLNCERQENIAYERKRSRESLEKQATKMLMLSDQKFSKVQVGTTVVVYQYRMYTELVVRPVMYWLLSVV